MFSFFCEEIDNWTIALYEKQGRAYKEIGVFFEDKSPRDVAFEFFKEAVTAVPTWQAIQHAIETEALGGEIPAYEMRLIDSNNRVLATVLWDVESVTQCVIDHKSRDIKTYRVVALAEIDSEDIEEEDIDWGVLAETGKFTVLDIQPNV